VVYFLRETKIKLPKANNQIEPAAVPIAFLLVKSNAIIAIRFITDNSQKLKAMFSKFYNQLFN